MVIMVIRVMAYVKEVMVAIVVMEVIVVIEAIQDTWGRCRQGGARGCRAVGGGHCPTLRCAWGQEVFKQWDITQTLELPFLLEPLPLWL